MGLKNYGHGLCGCCGGNGRPLYGNDADVTHRRYCSPCWNTLGVAPTSDNPFAETRRYVMARGWKRLNEGT